MSVCQICVERNIGPEHEITEKHIRNKALLEYSLNKSSFVGNRKGAHVSCSVKSSFSTNFNCVSPKIQISTKPGEQVVFKFTISNETKADHLLVAFVQTVHSKFNFVMSNHKYQIGSKPHVLRPKDKIQEEITVSFQSKDIGQYETPIIFHMQKKSPNETIVIMRDMVVFVEERQLVHEKMVTPYTLKDVHADTLYPSKNHQRYVNVFRIPKNCKRVYAYNLKLPEDANDIEKDLAEDIEKILETGTTKQNYIKYFHHLLWYEETVIRSNLKRYNMAGVLLCPAGNNYALHVPGLAEKRPSLMIGDLLFVKPQAGNNVMFEAHIKEVNDNLALIGNFHDNFTKHYSKDAKFDIRFFMSRVPLERMHNAVHNIKEVGQETKTFPERSNHVRRVNRKLEFYNPQVEDNPEQRRAVEHIVAGTSGAAPYLVHGPPGTGKTVTIVEAILQLVNKNPGNRIMVCTDSNMAADHVATLLIKYTHMFNAKEGKFLLRANSQYRVWETLPDCLKRYSNGTNRNDFYSVKIQDFITYNIVITTLSHAAKYARHVSEHRYNRHISHLFIDEAAQACEPASLIPVGGLLARAGALVLAGDPYQLGPVVISHNANHLGLGKSLMERLMKDCPLYKEEKNDPNYSVMLRNNFRSDPDILDIPDKLFYRGQLKAFAKPDKISTVDILGERKESRALAFHGVLSTEQKIGKSPSYFNTLEAEIVLLYVKRLVRVHRVLTEDVGIVTPYIRQVYTIKKGLSELGYDKIEVGTVEAYQGKEKRVIIISTVRANSSLLAHDAKFQLGFLVDDKRFNVAITRAKAKVIVIGNPLCLQKDVKWKMYMQRCRDLGTYHGFDFDSAEDKEVNTEIMSKINPLLEALIDKENGPNKSRRE